MRREVGRGVPKRERASFPTRPMDFFPPPPVEPMSHPDTLAASVSEPSAWGDRSAMEKTITGVLPKVTLISSPARVDLQTTKFTSEISEVNFVVITYHIDAFTP